MPNIKISQLPLYSGSASDLRWFVMNQSAETETFKYSGYSSPLKIGNTTNSVVGINLAPSSVAGSYDFNVGETNTITATGGRNASLGGVSNTIAGNSVASANIGGQNNTSNNGLNTTILGGSSNTNDGSSNSAAVGGISNYLNGASQFIAAGSNNFFGASNNSAIVAGQYHSIWYSDRVFVGGGYSHYIAPYLNLSDSAFLGGYDNEMGAGTNEAAIIGGRTNIIGGTSPRSSIIGGQSNNIQESANSVILAGDLNVVSGVSNNKSVIVSSNCLLDSSGPYNTIIASSDSSITGSNEFVVMLGTDTRVATRDLSTFVENLVIFNYDNLDFADDTAAAAGGVVLGQVYHDNGALRIRIA